MKIVIIGGGIAGLAAANFLLKKGMKVSVFEREPGNQAKGHAFLMHPAGISILENLRSLKPSVPVPGQLVEKVLISRPDLSDENETDLGRWLCLSRWETVQFLHALLPPEVVKFGHVFSHFEYKDGKAVTVQFTNGHSENGDVFIGADGAKSLIRQALFGETSFTPVEVKEIVGVVSIPSLIRKAPHTFRKFICHDKGLALGYVPCGSDRLVWFLQFDVRLQQNPDERPEALESLCRSLLADFPPEVSQILEAANFNNVYVWNSTDFDLMSSFNRENVFLIGDAAHVALPFTSAGTTNALQDAVSLSDCIHPAFDANEVGKVFYTQRASVVGEHIAFGRSIKNEFLRPSGAGRKASIPLIQHIRVEKK